MMDFLNFTFASFWHFAGMMALIAAVSSGVSDFIRAIVVRKGWKFIEPQFRQAVIDAIREERNKQP